jgi:hypothetical protein
VRGLTSCILNVCSAIVMLFVSWMVQHGLSETLGIMLIVTFFAAPLFIAAVVSFAFSWLQPPTKRDLLGVAFLLIVSHGGFWWYIYESNEPPARQAEPTAQLTRSTTLPPVATIAGHGINRPPASVQSDRHA